MIGAAGETFAQATSDVHVTWTENLGSSYRIASQSHPVGTVGADNPVITLQMGKRYRWTFADFFSHPMELFSLNGPSLLAQGGAVGTLESDATIAWLDTGADMYFNMNGKLGDALRATGTASYQCQVHPGIMGSTINFSAAASPLVWNGGTESFENALTNASVSDAIAGWVIADAATPSQYSAEITTTPSGHANQAPGSTRWLTVTDTEDSAAVNGRVYSNSIMAVGGAGRYVFSTRIDAQSIGAAAAVLVVSQHDDAGTFKNAAGLEITGTGVNAIILGADAGGVGKAGATVRSLLYNFADAGGFGQNAWVPVQFDLNFDAGTLSASATGTNGTTNKSTQISGLAMQGTANKDLFRFCLRGNGTGNTSVISYDNLALQGFAPNANVGSWEVYE